LSLQVRLCSTAQPAQVFRGIHGVSYTTLSAVFFGLVGIGLVMYAAGATRQAQTVFIPRAGAAAERVPKTVPTNSDRTCWNRVKKTEPS